MCPFASRLFFASLLLVCHLPAQAAQRTFVSTSGSDANTASSCANTAPCRGFGAALTVTDAGGEIIALSSGGYGPVTITKSVSLIAPEGVYAGISVLSGAGVTIATAGINVILRGLSVNSMGSSTRGVHMTDGAKLLVENCVISNFNTSSYAGVFVNTGAQVRVIDSVFRDNYDGLILSSGAQATVTNAKFMGNTHISVFATDSFGGGLVITSARIDRTIAQGGSTGFAAHNFNMGNQSELFVTDSIATAASVGIEVYSTNGVAFGSIHHSAIIDNDYVGLSANGVGSRLIVSSNTVARSTYGIKQDGSATVESAGDNSVRGNTTNVSGSITTTYPKI